jgi:ABC-2 type transport system ATP-binding protein
MMKWEMLALAVLAAACAPDATGPAPPARQGTVAFQGEEEGPPPPHDFGPDTYRTGLFTGQGITRPGLSCGESGRDGRVCSGFLPSVVDGALLDVTVMVPHGRGPHPLIVIMHGWGGDKSGWGDFATTLLGDGFAIVRYSARGFGASWGQVNLADVHVELEDLRSLIGQVVDDRRLRLNPDAVALFGASYGGGHSWLGTLEPSFSSPRGAAVRIRTVVPAVTWTDLLYSLIPNGRPRGSIHSPGSAKLSYINGLFTSGIRLSQGRPYPNYPDYLVTWAQWISAVEPNDADPVFRQIVDGAAGYRSVWWQQELWQDVAVSRLPIFQVQGFTDDLFPVTESKRMLLALKTLDPTYPIASYFGDLGHPRASNRSAEIDYVFGLIHEWMAFYLKGDGAEPEHVIRAAITRPRTDPFNPADVISAASFAELGDRIIAWDFEESSTLINPLSDPLGGFFWDPLVMEAARELEPLSAAPPSAVVESSLAGYEVAVAELSGGASLLIAGEPVVSLRAATLAHRVQLNVRLFDVRPDGAEHLVTRGTVTLDSGAAARPLGTVDVTIPTYGNVWEATAESVLRLEITNLDSPYIAPSRVPSVTEISNVRLEVPAR